MDYQNLNDYELISYVYENDEEARNILLKKYEPLILECKICTEYIQKEYSD